MKKSLKKLFLTLSTTIIMSTLSMSVSALDLEQEKEKYDAFLNTHCTQGTVCNEDKMIEMYSSINDDTIHYYRVGDFNVDRTEYYEEFDYEFYFPDDTGDDVYIGKAFTKCYVKWNYLEYPKQKTFPEDITEEKINSFLTDNGYNAQGTLKNDGTYDRFFIEYSQNVSEDEAIETTYALFKEFGIKPFAEFQMGFSGIFYDKTVPYDEYYAKEETTITSPSLNIGTITIAGDIDLNNEQGISDIVTLAKYNASPDLYPITDPTALANADMNQDGAINSLDATILIEMALGTYESAV